MRYQVLDNNQPADFQHHPKVHHSWDQSTFEEAESYANRWLALADLLLELNRPVDYSGYGDTIEIREVE